MIAQIPPQDRVPFAVVARRIAAELSDLLRLSLDVQHALSHCTCVHPADIETQRWLQGIDRISQSLADLATLMSGFALSAPPSAAVERSTVEACLRLRELAGKLAPTDAGIRPGEAHMSGDQGPPGEVHLF